MANDATAIFYVQIHHKHKEEINGCFDNETRPAIDVHGPKSKGDEKTLPSLIEYNSVL
jgi:hypothetical protein